MNEELQYITDNSGTQQPAWLHEDGTLVSYWTGLKTLLIQKNEINEEISHELAIELGYEL